MAKPCHTKTPAPETWTSNHQTKNPPAASLKKTSFCDPLGGGGMKKICTNLMAGLSSTPNGVLLWLKVGEGGRKLAPGKLIVYIYIDIYIYIWGFSSQSC